MQEIEKIALLGLLQDIGIFYQRAKHLDNTSKATYQWILDNKNLLEKSFNINIQEIVDIFNINSLHENELKKIIHLANQFLTEEKDRNNQLQEEIPYLHSIFESISFTEENLNNTFYHKLKPLSLKDHSIFPEILDKKTNNPLGNYEDLYNKFINDLSNLKNFKNKKAFYFIYYLFQKYLWCVPAKFSDISLFDHARILSALSSAIYDYYKNNNINLDLNQFENDEFLLLLEGDITGIQKFIYNIGKTLGIEDFSIAKALRGRSFSVALIPEILSRYILKELGYTITNLLYSGGGKFQILIANTEKNRNIIHQIEKDLEAYLFKNYYGEISIILSYLPFSGEYLTGKNDKNFTEIIEKNLLKLDEKKKQKFSSHLNYEFNNDTTCFSCKIIPVKNEDDDLCELCETSTKIGSIIPKIHYLVFDFDNKNIESNYFSLDKFGKVYFVQDKEIDQFKYFDEILKLNDTEFKENNGFKFIGNIVPIVNDENIEFFKKLNKDSDKKNNLKIGQVLEFDYLSKLAKGDSKLGIFRADVDNLGLIFSDGLKKRKGAYKYLIARIATLSRMLDLFFSGYINHLAEQISKEKFNINSSVIYIVYSGGDDLFIIAPYNITIEFALKLREEFYKYTANNLDFGLSGGIFISTDSLPIHLTAKFSEDLESRSKKVYYIDDKKNFFIKDSISIFNKTYRWKNFSKQKSMEKLLEAEQKSYNESESFNEFLSNIGYTKKLHLYFFDIILEISNKITEYYERKHVSRSFLHRLLELYKAYVEEGKNIKANIYPHIYYQIGRNLEKEGKIFFENLLIKEGYKKQETENILLTKEDIIKNLDIIISITLMQTRNKEGGKENES